MAAYITVGAKTTHGGEVITGSPHTTHNGVQVSRKGDKVICKKCKKLTTILTGDPSFIVDGAPIAREGDITSCGAKLIAIQQSFAESDFEVFGVEQPEPLFEQPAPLQFPKTDPEAVLASFRGSSDDSLSIRGRDSDEITDEELYALNDQMIDEAIADGGMVASSKYGNLETEQFVNRQAGNINKSVMNNNGSIHSGALPAYQQEQNRKTFDATVTIVGLAAGGGSVTILVKGSKYVVSKSALNLAKQGKTSVNALLKGAKKVVPNNTSVPKAMAAGAGGSAAFDFASQKLLNSGKPYNIKQTAVVAGVGTVGGGGGSVIANAAKVPYATATNLPKVFKNTTSMKIFTQQKAAETVGKTAAKDAIDD